MNEEDLNETIKIIGKYKPKPGRGPSVKVWEEFIDREGFVKRKRVIRRPGECQRVNNPPVLEPQPELVVDNSAKVEEISAP